MRSQAVKIVDGDTLTLPVQVREELGIDVGDTVVIEMSDGELHIRSLTAAVRVAQGIVREFAPNGVNLADQLIAERRADERHE